MNPILRRFEEAVRSARLVALATVLEGAAVGAKLLVWPDGGREGSLGDAALDAAVQERAMTLLRELRCEQGAFPTAAGPVRVFVDVEQPPPRLFVVGAVHTAIPLVTFARVLGFHTIVVDARAAFATRERFGHADELIVRWPADVLAAAELDAGSYVVVLTHDPKIDNPALAVAVASPARYVGALGARRTHARRVAALREVGVGDEQLARIRAPIGLAIGARRPEEIAVSIIAEIVAVMNKPNSYSGASHEHAGDP